MTRFRIFLIFGVPAIILMSFVLVNTITKIMRNEGKSKVGVDVAPPLQLPKFALKFDDSSVFNNSSLLGKNSLLLFGYTSCKTECAHQLDKMEKTVRIYLDINTGAKPPQVIFVSLDYERDTPETLRKYVDSFNPNFKGVVDDMENLKILLKSIGVFKEKIPTSPDDYRISHSTSVFFFNKSGELNTYYSAPIKPLRLASDIKNIE